MFVLCPHCQFLVALDPVSGQPPLRCPRCAQSLQGDDAGAAPSTDAKMPAEPATEHVQIDDASTDPMPGGDAETAGIESDPATDPVANASVQHIRDPDSVEPFSSAVDETTTGDDAIASAEDHADDTTVEHTASATDEPARTQEGASADSIIEAMLGPASIEVEAATESDTGQAIESADAPAPELPAEPAQDQPAAPDDPPENVVEPAPELAPAPAGAPQDAAADATPAPSAEAVPETDGVTEPDPPQTPTRPTKPAPSFVRRPAASSGVPPRRRWIATVAILALTVSLLLQLLLADRAQLAAEASWRPALSTLCDVLRCTLPPWREPAAFTLLQRDVRPHPTRRGALQVSATFRNDARWAQPWPGLVLTLSDVDGRVVGARTFAPREYLAANALARSARRATSTQDMLRSGQSATVTFDIVEPSPRIVAFTFDFK